MGYCYSKHLMLPVQVVGMRICTAPFYAVVFWGRAWRLFLRPFFSCFLVGKALCAGSHRVGRAGQQRPYGHGSKVRWKKMSGGGQSPYKEPAQLLMYGQRDELHAALVPKPDSTMCAGAYTALPICTG